MMVACRRGRRSPSPMRSPRPPAPTTTAVAGVSIQRTTLNADPTTAPAPDLPSCRNRSAISTSTRSTAATIAGCPIRRFGPTPRARPIPGERLFRELFRVIFSEQQNRFAMIDPTLRRPLYAREPMVFRSGRRRTVVLTIDRPPVSRSIGQAIRGLSGELREVAFSAIGRDPPRDGVVLTGLASGAAPAGARYAGFRRPRQGRADRAHISTACPGSVAVKRGGRTCPLATRQTGKRLCRMPVCLRGLRLLHPQIVAWRRSFPPGEDPVASRCSPAASMLPVGYCGPAAGRAADRHIRGDRYGRTALDLPRSWRWGADFPESAAAGHRQPASATMAPILLTLLRSIQGPSTRRRKWTTSFTYLVEHRARPDGNRHLRGWRLRHARYLVGFCWSGCGSASLAPARGPGPVGAGGRRSCSGSSSGSRGVAPPQITMLGGGLPGTAATGCCR